MYVVEFGLNWSQFNVAYPSISLRLDRYKTYRTEWNSSMACFHAASLPKRWNSVSMSFLIYWWCEGMWPYNDCGDLSALVKWTACPVTRHYHALPLCVVIHCRIQNYAAIVETSQLHRALSFQHTPYFQRPCWLLVWVRNGNIGLWNTEIQDIVPQISRVKWFLGENTLWRAPAFRRKGLSPFFAAMNQPFDAKCFYVNLGSCAGAAYLEKSYRGVRANYFVTITLLFLARGTGNDETFIAFT